MATVQVELWVLIDANGDYGQGKDKASADESYENDIQPLADAEGLRCARLTVTLPLPTVIELEGEVEDEEAPSTLMVKS